MRRGRRGSDFVIERVAPDHHRVSHEVTIVASPDRVWASLTDNARLGQWSPTLVGLSGEIVPGGTVAATFRSAGGRATLDKPLIEVVDGRSFGWSGRVAPGVTDRHLFRIEPLDDGRCRFVQSDEARGPGARVAGSAFTHLVGRGMERFNLALKAEVERGAAAPADSVLRIGVLGAAKITGQALIRPAARTGVATVTAVAARSSDRAHRFASKHNIDRVHETYEDLVADPEIDAVYVPLPPSHHAEWTIAAIEAGKHVLCEKPFALDAGQAETVAAAAHGSGLVVMEALHWRYHPMAERMLELVASGSIGALTDVSASFCVPILDRHDIRWNSALGGGALGDLGSYTVHQLRTITGEEPTVVTASQQRWRGVDRSTSATLRFPSGVTGTIQCSMASRRVLSTWLRITGTEGSILAVSPVLAHAGWLRVTSGGRTRTERPGSPATHDHQLRAFAAAVADGTPYPTDLADAIANLAVLDQIRERARVV